MHIMCHLQDLHPVCQPPPPCIQTHFRTEHGQEHLSMEGFFQGTLLSPCPLGFSRLCSPLMLEGLWDGSLEGR